MYVPREGPVPVEVDDEAVGLGVGDGPADESGVVVGGAISHGAPNPTTP